MFLLGYPQCSWRGDVFLTLGSRKTETLSHKHRMCKKYLFVNGVSTSIITTQDGSTYSSVTRYKFIIEANPDYGISFFKVSTKTAPLPLSKKKKKRGGGLVFLLLIDNFFGKYFRNVVVFTNMWFTSPATRPEQQTIASVDPRLVLQFIVPSGSRPVHQFIAPGHPRWGTADAEIKVPLC